MRISELVEIHNLMHGHTGIGTPIIYPGHIDHAPDAYRVMEHVMRTRADADGTVVIPGDFLFPEDFKAEDYEDAEEYAAAAQEHYLGLERVIRDELWNLSYKYESEDGEDHASLRIIGGCGGTSDEDGRLKQCTVKLTQVFDEARKLGHCPEWSSLKDIWFAFELSQDTVSHTFELSAEKS